MATRRAILRRLTLTAVLSSAWFPAALAQDRAAEFLARFKQENDPVRKAKLLPKLGDEQLSLAGKEIAAGNYDRALAIIEEYRDEVKQTTDALKATGVDAERKPGGFKQLQIHVRKSIRDLEQAILVVPEDQRESFEALRRDLLAIEKELIDMLFPRRPGKIPEKERPKG